MTVAPYLMGRQIGVYKRARHLPSPTDSLFAISAINSTHRKPLLPVANSSIDNKNEPLNAIGNNNVANFTYAMADRDVSMVSYLLLLMFMYA